MMPDPRRRRARAAAAILACLPFCGGCEENTLPRSGRGSPVIVVSASVDPRSSGGPVHPGLSPAISPPMGYDPAFEDDPPAVRAEQSAMRDADPYRINAVDPAELDAAGRQAEDAAG